MEKAADKHVPAPAVLPKGTKVGLMRLKDDVLLQDRGQIRSMNAVMQSLLHRPQMHPWCVCMICTGGELTVTVDYRTFRSQPGTMLLVLPQQIVELQAVSPDYEGMCIMMSEKFTFSLRLSDTLRTRLSIQREPFYHLEEQHVAAFENFFGMMQGIMQHKDNPYRPKVVQLLTEAYFYGMGYYLHMHADTRDKNTAEFQTEQYLRLVERDFKRQHYPDYYAAQLCLSKKYLSACVKKATGQTATHWLERHIILHAQSLLEEPALSVKEVADALHFPSQSFFGRYFKRLTGLSPLAYRARHAAAR